MGGSLGFMAVLMQPGVLVTDICLICPHGVSCPKYNNVLTQGDHLLRSQIQKSLQQRKQSKGGGFPGFSDHSAPAGLT